MTDLSIAAILPLCNGARWIDSSVLFAQTLQPDDFIVVDDGATDGGAVIVGWLAQGQRLACRASPTATSHQRAISA